MVHIGAEPLPHACLYSHMLALQNLVSMGVKFGVDATV